MLRQLLEQFETLPDFVRTEYFKDKKPGVETGLGTYKELFKSSASEFSKRYDSNRIFILVDAYDEFINEKNERKERGEFRDFLGDISKCHQASFLITTRVEYDQELSDSISSPCRVTMTGDLGDIERFLEREFQYEDDKKQIIQAIREANKEEK